MGVAIPTRDPAELSRERGTLDELIARLGDIPLSRIRRMPPPGMATEADVIDADSNLNTLCELVDGVLVEKPIGYLESRLAASLIQALRNYMDEHDLGIVAGEAGMLKLSPGLVRIPDVSVVLWESLPGGLCLRTRSPRSPRTLP